MASNKALERMYRSTLRRIEPELKELRGFLAVADARGFRRAAHRLGIEQSVLSRRVYLLEEILGVSLFERHRGGVRLTGAGERFRLDVRSALDNLDVAVARARGAGIGQHGSLRIGVGATLYGGELQRLIRAWREHHSSIELVIVEASPQEHLANIAGRHLDVAIVAGSDWAGSCELEELWQDQVNVIVPSELAGEFTIPVPLSELVDKTFIVSRSGFGPQVCDWIIRRLSSLSRSPRVEFVDASRSVLFSLIGLGLGVTFGTGAEAEVSYPNIAFLPVDGESIPYSALWSAENGNPALRRFLSLARVHVRLKRPVAP